jgi:hypothetical protein
VLVTAASRPERSPRSAPWLRVRSPRAAGTIDSAAASAAVPFWRPCSSATSWIYRSGSRTRKRGSSLRLRSGCLGWCPRRRGRRGVPAGRGGVPGRRPSSGHRSPDRAGNPLSYPVQDHSAVRVNGHRTGETVPVPRRGFGDRAPWAEPDPALDQRPVPVASRNRWQALDRALGSTGLLRRRSRTSWTEWARHSEPIPEC